MIIDSFCFRAYCEQMTSLQISFLRAIADGVEQNLSQKEIIRKYNLGTSANVSRLRKSMEQKELIDITKGRITFNDPVFKQWFKREFKIKMTEEELNKFSTNLFWDTDTSTMDKRCVAFIAGIIFNYGYSTNYVPYFME